MSELDETKLALYQASKRILELENMLQSVLDTLGCRCGNCVHCDIRKCFQEKGG